MTIKQPTNSSKTVEPRNGSEAISDKTLDSVVGGLNPQPLPPRVFNLLSVSTIKGIVLR